MSFEQTIVQCNRTSFPFVDVKSVRSLTWLEKRENVESRERRPNDRDIDKVCKLVC